MSDKQFVNFLFFNVAQSDSGQGEMSLVQNCASYSSMINHIQISCNFVTLRHLFVDNVIHTAQKVGSE